MRKIAIAAVVTLFFSVVWFITTPNSEEKTLMQKFGSEHCTGPGEFVDISKPREHAGLEGNRISQCAHCPPQKVEDVAHISIGKRVIHCGYYPSTRFRVDCVSRGGRVEKVRDAIVVDVNIFSRHEECVGANR